MPPSPPPAASMSGSRAQILSNAARLFSQHGYAAVSLRDIAAVSGMKAGSLYSHFESKNQIVTEILNHGVQSVFAEVRNAVEALPPGARVNDILHAAIHAHLRALLESGDFTSANVRIHGQLPQELKAAVAPLRKSYEKYWLALLTRCAEQKPGFSGEVSLSVLRAFILGAMNSSLEWRRSSAVSTENLADQLVHIFLSGVRKSHFK